MASSNGRFWLGLKIELAVFFKVMRELLWLPACLEEETTEDSSEAKQALELVENQSISA